MRRAGHAKPMDTAAGGGGGGGGGNLAPLSHYFKNCDRKVRFEDRGRNAESGHGGGGCTATTKQLKDKAAEKPRLSQPPDGVAPKDKQRDQPPSSKERQAQQQAVNQVQEIRLRGKLKWLFEQDRMYWESNSRSNSRSNSQSNSAKSSRRGSPEVDRSRSLNGEPKPAMDSPNDAKVVHVVEESFRRVSSSKMPPVNKLKPQRQVQPDDKAMVSNGGGLSSGRRENSSSAKMPWTFSNSTAKFWPRGKCKAPQDSSNPPSFQNKSRAPAVKQSCVELTKRVKANDCVTLLSKEEILSDYDDAPKSGESSEICTSSDEDEEMRKKVDVVLARGGGGSLQDVKNQAAYLKVKCDMLSKEKEHAMRKWKRSRHEIDDAARMAQALRTAIETLLEAGACDSGANFKAKQDIIEDQTEALKMRMEILRGKNSEGLRRQSKVQAPSVPLEERVETLKKTSEGRSLASPEIPKDTEHKVEALRTRLEKLMLATNSRVSDEQRQLPKRAKEQKKPVEEWLQRQKSQSDEKAELKMKGWLNSLSAELTSEASPDTSRGTCATSAWATPFISKQPSPSTSKQESPCNSAHDRDPDGPGSAPSSVDTKKNVIHKIAEEVRLEAEQWFQVQELLGRVGEDMKSLQEACSTWERRAIRAEAQVVQKQQQPEGQEQIEKKSQLGDEKLVELQKEMFRLRETVDEVKKQVGDISIDPSRWFEAAQNFGYAFMPVNLNLRDTTCGCKSKCNHSSFDRGPPRSSGDQGPERNSATSGANSQPTSATSGANSQSTSSATTSAIMTSSEKTAAENGARQRSQLPSQEWAKEIAKAEEDEILTTANGTGQVPKLEFPNDTVVKETSSASREEKSHERPSQEKTAKLFHKELGLESSGSRGDMLLQMTASIRERCSTILQQEEQLLRFSNLSASRRPRSPLKDVLENITSAKENKRPY